MQQGRQRVFDLENNLSFVALESSQGNGITFNAAGSSLTAAFPNATMNEWHHIAVTHHARDNLTGIYLDEICRTKGNTGLPQCPPV